MAKIRQNNFLDTVDEVFTSAKNAGVLHLNSEGEIFNGRTIRVGGKLHYHFGTTGYLGLEQDQRLKSAAKDAIDRYGTQFPLSKSYISHPLYSALEESVGEMYQNPIVITKNSTLGHLGVIPTAVRDDDGVILDHQVHWSVQNATQLLKNRGVPVEMIRHNRLDMLEDKIKQLTGKCKKIWYMADGVYSMYGDYAPIEELMELSRKYPQLHLYFDDVHGMSWNGKNGTGYVMNVLEDLPENILLIGTLSKTFGASGAVAVCADKKLHSKIKNFGGPLTFSAQLEPASVGAALASAKIHLSPEIYRMQSELQGAIAYFNSLLLESDLPLINQNDSPVFYVGTGMPATGYNFVQRLLKEGFYVNLGIFPAVPVKNTGVRITISRHNKSKDIRALVEAMKYHHPRALAETGTNLQKIYRAFRLPVPSGTEPTKDDSSPFTVTLKKSIREISRKEWDSMFSGKGVLDWEGQVFQEKAFSDNQKQENNWLFRYIIIKDSAGQPVVASCLTHSLWKDDLLAPEDTSLQVEKKRKNIHPYYLTSKVMSTGSLFTEGDHLFLDPSHPHRISALKLFLDKLEELERELPKTSMTVLRDFPVTTPLNQLFHDRGFIRLNMPDSCVFSNFTWNSSEDFSHTLSKRSRRHFEKDVRNHQEKIHTRILQKCEPEQLTKFRDLYENVRKRNPGLNTFSFPLSLFMEMNRSEKWEFLTVHLKEQYSASHASELVGVMFCYRNARTYVPSFVGMVYDYHQKFSIYRQLLHQTILRARELEMEKIDFGMTASFEKKKMGAKVVPKVCYVQARDNYSFELLETLQGNHKKIS